jgi:hypothetical protein
MAAPAITTPATIRIGTPLEHGSDPIESVLYLFALAA